MILIFLPLKAIPGVSGPKFRPGYKVIFWIWVALVILLGWLGAQPVENPFILMSRMATSAYFITTIILLPLITKIEHNFLLNQIKKN